MSRHQRFDIDHTALRDNAEPARVLRVWARLESNLVPRSPTAKRSLSLAWVPALAGGLAVGFLVGHEYSMPTHTAPSTLVAEPTSLEPAASPEQQPTRETTRAEPPKPDDSKARRRSSVAHPVLPLEEPVEVSEVPDAPVVETAAPSTIVRAAPAQALWLQLADRGEYERAYHSLEEYGGFDMVLLRASADELMVLVDVARATGNRGRAIQALRRVTESFVSDPNAPIAAMTLGRMLMQAGDRKGASEAFSLYRRLSPEGDFAEDALASDIQAAVEEGNWERAQTLAKQYETDFPDGRHLEQIREQLTQANGSSALQANGGGPVQQTGSQAPEGQESESATPPEVDVDEMPPAKSPYE